MLLISILPYYYFRNYDLFIELYQVPLNGLRDNIGYKCDNYN
jgi:hypothetical protein